MKETIIGYIPPAIVFGGPPSVQWLSRLLCSSWLDYSSCHGEFNSAALCVGGMSIFSFAIGGILNLAFLIYYYFDDSASKGIVSTGGVVTAIITLVTQLDLIGHGKSAIVHWVFP